MKKRNFFVAAGTALTLGAFGVYFAPNRVQTKSSAPAPAPQVQHIAEAMQQNHHPSGGGKNLFPILMEKNLARIKSRYLSVSMTMTLRRIRGYSSLSRTEKN
jgi:hypothetical protein